MTDTRGATPSHTILLRGESRAHPFRRELPGNRLSSPAAARSEAPISPSPASSRARRACVLYICQTTSPARLALRLFPHRIRYRPVQPTPRAGRIRLPFQGRRRVAPLARGSLGWPGRGLSQWSRVSRSLPPGWAGRQAHGLLDLSLKAPTWALGEPQPAPNQRLWRCACPITSSGPSTAFARPPLVHRHGLLAFASSAGWLQLSYLHAPEDSSFHWVP